MGLKNSLVLFRKEYNKEKKNVPALSGKAKSNNIFTYTLREDEVGRQLAASAIIALKPYKDKLHPVQYNNITSDAYCTDVAKTVLTGIRQRRRPNQLQSLAFPAPFRPPLQKLTSFPKWSDFTGSPGVYVLGRTQGGRGVSIRFVSGSRGGNDGAVSTLNRELRDVLWGTWLQKTRTGIRGLQSRGVAATGQQMQIAHDEETTVGAMMLKSLKESKPNMQIAGTITVTEIVDQIEKNLGIDLDRNYQKTKNGFSFKWNITASLRFNQAGSEATDRSRISPTFATGSLVPKQKKVPGGGMDSSKAAVALIQLFRKRYGTTAMMLWVAKGSRPPKQQAIEGHASSLVDGIVRPLTKAGIPDMRFKVNKLTKNFKKTKDSGAIKKPEKASKPKTKTVRRSEKVGGTAVRPQRDKRKGAQNINRLQALINKRLPAQVRRNMGKPALTNRTGNFSNSVRLLKMRQVRGGLTGDYTYTRTGGGSRPPQPGVYETFENTGTKQWPAGYNPKDLIKKSIRDLAMQYTEEKFVQLRRQ